VHRGHAVIREVTVPYILHPVHLRTLCTFAPCALRTLRTLCTLCTLPYKTKGCPLGQPFQQRRVP